MTPDSLFAEAASSEIGIAVETTDPARLRESLWVFQSGTEWAGLFLITTSPYCPKTLWIIHRSAIPDHILSQRGGTTTKANWNPRGPEQVPTEESLPADPTRDLLSKLLKEWK